MRDFSCFGDAAVTLAAGAAGGGGGGGGAAAALDRSLQAATASDYRVALSSRKELRIKVTWTRGVVAGASGAVAGAAGGPTGIALAIDDGSSLAAPPPLAAVALIGTQRRTAPAPAPAQHFLQKKRGTRSFVTDAGTAVSIYWDTAEAKYCPPGAAEPSRDYHLAVVADGELALLLGGGVGGEAARDVRRRYAPAPRRALLSRREQVRGPFSSSSSSAPPAHQLVHTTRCRFRDDGAEHDVTVACRGDEWGSRDGEVSVSVDGKKVVEARRVKWNFRGNRTAVLGDGAVVEVMWDVHDWWFAGVHGGGGGGGAQFMVKARGAADGGRVWMDEEMANKGHPPAGFFLHLQCYRR
ncbi:hypothetical protein BDA96_02G140200 [Sorghum bicolor]|jgi:hypothetical protein|uniref:DUF868 domain-containing protein n=1 Tax=Sorghum bicolor TaxID=4558 RepID=A0A921USJ7_SORBI|nr:hypothetical protein BDA96_02G140200 [Sorghum bicolor]